MTLWLSFLPSTVVMEPGLSRRSSFLAEEQEDRLAALLAKDGLSRLYAALVREVSNCIRLCTCVTKTMHIEK